MLFSGLAFFLFWGAVIWMLVWGIRSLTDGRRGDGGEDAVTIAERRYARGEITREEMETIKKVLGR
jgi:uncharacterized membrane protein